MSFFDKISGSLSPPFTLPFLNVPNKRIATGGSSAYPANNFCNFIQTAGKSRLTSDNTNTEASGSSSSICLRGERRFSSGSSPKKSVFGKIFWVASWGQREAVKILSFSKKMEIFLNDR